MIPNPLKKFSSQLLYFLCIPAYAMLFLILYHPFRLEELLDFQLAGYVFNISIICSINLLVMLLSRQIFYFSKVYRIMTIGWYRVWCLCEVFVSVAFIALYITLIGDLEQSYFDILIIGFSYLFAIELLPYAIIEMSMHLEMLNIKLRNKEGDDGKRIRFYDERRNLKFVVASSAITYIAADENYVHIYYIDNGHSKEYVLRSTMKKIEEVCADNGIYRCHRSYFINPTKIKALRRESDGSILAELNLPDAMDSVPVTKRYYDTISTLV